MRPQQWCVGARAWRRAGVEAGGPAEMAGCGGTLHVQPREGLGCGWLCRPDLREAAPPWRLVPIGSLAPPRWGWICRSDRIQTLVWDPLCRSVPIRQRWGGMELKLSAVAWLLLMGVQGWVEESHGTEPPFRHQGHTW